MFVDWTQDAELAADLQKIGERLHEEYLAGKREERRRKSLQKLEDEAMVRSKKMQKRSEEDTVVEVKAEDSGDDKDDIPLAQRLEMLTGKAKNGQVKAEDHPNGVHTDNYISSAVTNGAKGKFEDDSTMKESNGEAEEKAEVEEVEEVETKLMDSLDGEIGEGVMEETGL